MPENSNNRRYLSADEVVRQKLRDITVAEHESVQFSPDNREYADCFATVQLKTFSDLQTLGIVPRGPTEELVRNAITADDEEVFRLTNQLLPQDKYIPSPNTNKQSVITSNYRAHRKNTHITLAKVYSDALGTSLEWNSPVVKIGYNWIKNAKACHSRLALRQQRSWRETSTCIQKASWFNKVPI
jgi:hypothetical protein